MRKKCCLNEYSPRLKPVVYRHHVDEIFVLFKSKDQLKLLVNYMNSKHKNTKFTFEGEGLNNFASLDVKITRKKKRFFASIFHKAIFSRIYTNYDTKNHVYFWYLQGRFSSHAFVLAFQNFLEYEKSSHESRIAKKYFQM